jgi:hypothetical protein
VKRLALLVAVFCAPLTFCVRHRTIVTQPAIEVHVTDASGAPVAGAEVVVLWWSYPYGRLEEAFRFTTDAQGALVTTEATKSERIAPFCMHGVKQHEYHVCAGAPGQGWKAVPIEARGTAPLTLQLPGGTYAGECADLDAARFGPRVPPDAGVSDAGP